MPSLNLPSPFDTQKPIDFVEADLTYTLFFRGIDYFAALEQSILEAKYEILIESYIFHFDHVGQSILLKLQEAALRGVAVRLLVDGIGSIEDIPEIANFCKLCGITFEVYHPLPLQSQISHHSPLLTYQSLRKRLALIGRVNKRNHRKLVLIDQRLVYLGSLNICAAHMDQPGLPAWRDTGLRASGSDVKLIKREMDVTWERAVRFWWPAPRMRRLPIWLRLNSRARWRRRTKRSLFHFITHAEKRILITTPYFVPEHRLLSRLIKAAERGVEVGVLVPHVSDVFIVKHASRAFYRDLMQRGIQIWEYMPSVLHAKTLIIDDYGFVGSYNMNHRSFLHDLEIEIVTKNTRVVDELLKQWQADLAVSQSAETSLKRLRKRDRMLSWFFQLFKHWL
jgi:cardiolipin synthase